MAAYKKEIIAAAPRAKTHGLPERLPNYKPSYFFTAQAVARAYRQYAKYKLKEARANERYVQRLLTGTPEPNRTSHQPWEFRKFPKSNPLVLRYTRKAKRLRDLATQALERARFYSGVWSTPMCRKHSDCRRYPELGRECATSALRDARQSISRSRRSP